MEEKARAWRYVIHPIHPAGRIFVLSAAVLAVVLFWISTFLGWLGVGLTAVVAYFFRDPERVPPEGAGFVVSPADGHVVGIVDVAPPPEMDMGDEPRLRVSVFLSVFDVHVNRVPVGGTVRRIRYTPGRTVNAVLDKASEENERNAIHILTLGGQDVVVVQIAGLVARRIVCSVPEGAEVHTGERMGIIRFGSRADVYLPRGTRVHVKMGQTMIGGETVLAQLSASDSA
jgi:phosphatidylserine decarboxylase